ncbi:MAG: hypothetical protein ACOZE5_03285 [Verrucomicrobiota bacterium]
MGKALQAQNGCGGKMRSVDFQFGTGFGKTVEPRLQMLKPELLAQLQREKPARARKRPDLKRCSIPAINFLSAEEINVRPHQADAPDLADLAFGFWQMRKQGMVFEISNGWFGEITDFIDGTHPEAPVRPKTHYSHTCAVSHPVCFPSSTIVHHQSEAADIKSS